MIPAELLEKLYARRRFGIRPGLERIQTLLQRLGNPERNFRTIHIVGTNGKGSSAAFLSSILIKAGQRTALFTSPHLVSFCERFRINGQELPAASLTAQLERILDCAPEEATFFEIVTALAALAFSEGGVEVACIEAGMGGRCDSTAALPGIMTLVTPVSLDHCDYLGRTVTEIFLEKIAIAEPGTPILIGYQSEQTAPLGDEFTTGRRILRAGMDFKASWNRPGSLDYSGINHQLRSLEPGIPGHYQAENIALALAAAELLNDLQLPVSTTSMISGIATAKWPGRMELIPGTPPLLLDGAHNQAGAEALAKSLAIMDYKRLIMISGVMADKDVRALLSPLVPLISSCLCVTPRVERALDGNALCQTLRDMGVAATFSANIGDALTKAREMAQDGDLILICGSLFLVGETKAYLQGSTFEGIRG